MGESMRFRTNKAVPDFALLYILSNLFFNSLTYFSNHSFSCFVTYNGTPPLDELRRTSIATMAEHNIVVFAGDHCGPEVTDSPPELSHL